MKIALTLGRLGLLLLCLLVAAPPVLGAVQPISLEQQIRQTSQLGKTDLDQDSRNTETWISNAKLSATVLARQRQALADWKARQSQYNQIANSPSAVDQFIFINSPKLPGVKVDPQHLAHRTATGKPRAPAEKSQAFADGFARTDTVAVAAGSPWPKSAQAPLPRAAADLAEAEEIQLTPAIRALADQLHRNPVEIYQWVRQNIDFEPSYGSIQGADLTLRNRRGNALDTASLLIGLYRASGIAARYGYGTVEISADRLIAWLRVPSIEQAQQLLNQGGIPTTALTAGGKVVAVRMEHAWAEAFVDFFPSRGARHVTGDTWVPVDASYKQYREIPGVNLKSVAPFDAAGALNQLMSGANITADSITGLNFTAYNQALDAYAPTAWNALTARSAQPSMADLIGRADILPENTGMLAGSLPYKVVALGGKPSALAASVMHRLVIKLYGSEVERTSDTPTTQFTISLPKLALRSLGVHYQPATADDQAVIDAARQSGKTTLPLYLINVIPQIQIDGVTVAAGAAFRMGQAQYLQLELQDPQGLNNSVELYGLHAGDEAQIGVNPAGISLDLLQERTSATTGSSSREGLYVAGLSFWAQHDHFDQIAARSYGVRRLRLPSAGLFLSPLSVSYRFGTPFSGNYQSYSMDVKRNLQGLAAPDRAAQVAYLTQSGGIGSYLEGAVFTELFSNGRGVALSTAHVMMVASQLRIPIYTVNAGNIGTVMPKLLVSESVKEDIRNAIQAGKVVQVPEREIAVGEWSGTGYVIQDPDTGAAAYMLDQGTNGGSKLQCAAELIPLKKIFFRFLTQRLQQMIQSVTQRLVTAALGAAAGVMFVATAALAGNAMYFVAYHTATVDFTVFMAEHSMAELARMAGVTLASLKNICQDKGPDICPLGGSKGPPKPHTPNPINIASGNKVWTEIDYEGAGPFPLRFVRTYNSQGQMGQWFGDRWSASYEQRVAFDLGGVVSDQDVTGYVPTHATVYRPNGQFYQFLWINNQFVPDPDITEQLVRQTNAQGQTTGWLYITNNDETERFDANGNLLSISNRAGLTQTVEYANGRISRVVDPFGRSLTFSFDADGNLTQINDPAGQPIRYTPDYQVAQVTYPGGAVYTYHYDEPALIGKPVVSARSNPPPAGSPIIPGLLTGLSVDGQRLSSYTYDEQGRTIESIRAGNTERWRLTYYDDGSTDVLDPGGTVHTYQFIDQLGLPRLTGLSEPCASCGANQSANYTYDANGFVASKTDFSGRKTLYVNNARGLEEKRTEAAGSADERVITTTWDAVWRLPRTVTEPSAIAGVNKVTTFDYDARGTLKSRTVKVGADTRTWTYTPNALGWWDAIDGPRTDVNDSETYRYNADGTLAQSTNALGHTTRTTRFDAHGRPLEQVDPNQVITTFSYHPRGWLSGKTKAGESTGYGFDSLGNIQQLTLPDGSGITYQYDAAKRLAGLTDSLGQKVVYTLDQRGNREVETTYDPANNIVGEVRRAYDSLGRLAQDIGATDPQNQITRYTYTSDGELKTVTEPGKPATLTQYDNLARLKSHTDAKSGITQYGYDAQDNLASVTDARSLKTQYKYNGFNDLTQLISPDTGTTGYTPDAAGNVTQQTDARGVTTTFSFDANNRIRQALYGDETITYSYDQGPNALGRLSTLTDGSGNTSLGYDALGRVTGKTQTVTLPNGNRSLTVGYQHNQGQLKQLTLPSGHTLNYSYQNGQVASITLNGQPLISSIQFYPFGELKGWAIQGKTLTRSFDRDGRVSGYSLPTGSRTLGYDAVSRITSLTDSISASLNQTFGYDTLDRLTSATGAVNQSFDYDAVGNRLKLTQGTQVTTYTPAANSNRLASIAAANSTTLGYDAVGNITSDGTFSYVYNNRNRLAKVTQAAVTKATYLYNGFGERVAKIVGTTATLYAYDEDGHTLGEYDGTTGTPIQETVWLNDTPVAVIKPKVGSTTPEVYVIYPDHLDTPRVITDATGKIVWRWDSAPFGETAANDDPDADGVAFVYNLRFPGQVFDAETKLHYNYFRDYNPGTGRYVQSDPIGLSGGVNTFAYLENNPVDDSDSSGLKRSKRKRGYPPEWGKKPPKDNGGLYTCRNVQPLVGTCGKHCPPYATGRGWGATLEAAKAMARAETYRNIPPGCGHIHHNQMWCRKGNGPVFFAGQ